MQVDGQDWRTIWRAPDGTGLGTVRIIDQTKLPFALETRALRSLGDACAAISDMQVRGAPLIGAMAAYGMALAAAEDPCEGALLSALRQLVATRPTASNLETEARRALRAALAATEDARAGAAFAHADAVADEDVARNRSIGDAGLSLIETLAERRQGGPVQILTHCNAGWLATVDWGTATAPIYRAHAAGIDLHVWVDETRPRNQGGHLTAWELAKAGVAHTVIVDNAGGHLMQRGEVDLCLVGTDRTAANGDVANKIGTYLKALAAHDCGVPFYVCLPSPTIDWGLASGGAIPIEARAESEVTEVDGLLDGKVVRTRVVNPGSPAANPAFDVTPARLVTGLVTERGVVAPGDLAGLFPDRAA